MFYKTLGEQICEQKSLKKNKKHVDFSKLLS
jgi:hypothetical protein